MKVSFQGLKGAYSELAASQYFPLNTEFISCYDFEEAFAMIENNSCDFAMIPVENNTAGIVEQSHPYFHTDNIWIHDHFSFLVQHQLLGTSNCSLEKIQKVISHPQALKQCDHFLNTNNLKKEEYYDTAGAAKHVAELKNKTLAAIASSLAAKHYQLKIIKENIQSNANNSTRFYICSKSKKISVPSNSILILSVRSKNNETSNFVKEIQNKNWSIESTRSVSPTPNENHLILEVQTNSSHSKVSDFMKKHKEICKWIGCIPKDN